MNYHEKMCLSKVGKSHPLTVPNRTPVVNILNINNNIIAP